MPITDHHGLLIGAALVGVPSTIWLLSRRSKPSNSEGTDFESYLKHVEAAANPSNSFCETSFEAYLRGNSVLQPEAVESTGASSQAADKVLDMPMDRMPVTVLFGTEYGFSKEVAERLADRLKQTGTYWPQLLDMADHPEGLPLDSKQALLVVCSTQGDGVPPGEAREFCDWLHSSAAPPLLGVQFAVCALGDRSYQHFCRCGKALDARLVGLGATRFHERADINREDWKAINAWIDGVLEALPCLQLKTAEELGEQAPVAESGHVGKKWSKAKPYLGTVTAVDGLCSITSKEDKNTYLVEIDLGESGLTYTPGDALGVWPNNCSQAVDELLSTLGAEPGLLVQVPSWHYQDPEVGDRTTMTLKDALTKCYDLRSPKHDLLRLLLENVSAQRQSLPKKSTATANGISCKNGKSVRVAAEENGHVEDEEAAHAAAVGELVEPNGFHEQSQADDCIVHTIEQLSLLVDDEEAIERYLEPRHVIDVLTDFLPARLSVGEVLGELRALQPRLYSISSSQLENERSVQATVAVVRYSSLNKDRIGVASTYLTERLEVGQQVPIYIHKNPDFRLPADHSTPIIMVGPGTGLAPFRAFMQERIIASQQEGTAFGPCVLFFGCRRRDQDYLYSQLLEGWATEGKLQLFTAFSREQAHKVYVQNRIQESAELIWSLLQDGAHFYVCGDAASMAGQVEEALLEVIHEHGQEGSTAAQVYLDSLAEAGRYQRDVWF